VGVQYVEPAARQFGEEGGGGEHLARPERSDRRDPVDDRHLMAKPFEPSMQVRDVVLDRSPYG